MQEIAEELCITQRYLRAIENDDLKSLPGVFFYKSFARQYAAALGVSERQIQAGIDQLTALEQEAPLPGRVIVMPERPAARWKSLLALERRERTSPPPVRQPDPIVETGNRDYFTDRRIGPAAGGLLAVLLACSGFYAWWNKAPQIRAAHTQSTTNVQNNSAATLPAAGPAPPNGAPSIQVSAAPEGGDPNQVVLNLSATERTWLSITSDGKEIFSGILQPSQTKTLTGMDVAKMKVGNAGGLEIRWNGKEIGPIGERGQVKTILFTRDNFEILEPMPPADSGDTL